jgi:nucleoside-diphosphate-sugar epimerase
VDHFVRGGAEVENFDIVPPRNEAHRRYWKCVDMLNLAGLLQHIARFQPEIILHMAARTDLHGRGIEDYPVNTIGVSNLVECLRRHVCPRLVIFASSMLVCRLGYLPKGELDFCPNTAYGQSKCQGEKLVRKEAGSFFPWIILRPTSLWGPWFSSPYRDFFSAVSRGIYLHPRGKEIRRSYGFVLNAVHQIERLIVLQGADFIGRSVYLADYEPIELGQWAREIQKCLEAPPIHEVPQTLLLVAAIIGDLLKSVGWKDVPLTSFRLRNLLTQAVYDTSEFEKACGPVPYTMRQGVTITCEWMTARS